MSSFGVRGLNTAGLSCGDTITVVSGRTNNTGFSSSVESEPSSSSGCVRGHPSGGDEGDEGDSGGDEGDEGDEVVVDL